MNPNPAAFAALAAGDISNAIAASTPGGIAAQEAAGQRAMLAACNFPKNIEAWQYKVTHAMLEAAWGIKFTDNGDDLFFTATLPPGWRMAATDHSMNSELIDAAGAKRAHIFYKAAFYDRRADAAIFSRYIRTQKYHGVYPCQLSIVVEDRKTGAVLRESAQVAHDAFKELDREEAQAVEWLDFNFPDHKNPLAYWAD